MGKWFRAKVYIIDEESCAPGSQQDGSDTSNTAPPNGFGPRVSLWLVYHATRTVIILLTFSQS